MEEQGEEGDEEEKEKAASHEGGHQVDRHVGVVVEQLGRLLHLGLHEVILRDVEDWGCKTYSINIRKHRN